MRHLPLADSIQSQSRKFVSQFSEFYQHNLNTMADGKIINREMRLIYNQFQLTLDELYSNMVSGVSIQRLNKSQLEFNKRFLDQFDRFFVFLGSTQLWWHAINFIRAD